MGAHSRALSEEAARRNRHLGIDGLARFGGADLAVGQRARRVVVYFDAVGGHAGVFGQHVGFETRHTAPSRVASAQPGGEEYDAEQCHCTDHLAQVGHTYPADEEHDQTGRGDDERGGVAHREKGEDAGDDYRAEYRNGLVADDIHVALGVIDP